MPRCAPRWTPIRSEQTEQVLAAPGPAQARRHMRIGVIGAGQLGRMLALAGYPLGLRFVFLDASADAPGGQVGPIITGCVRRSASCLAQLAQDVDVVTYEFENVPVDARSRGSPQRCPFLPPVEALGVSQDRLHEKDAVRRLGIPTPPFRAVESLADLERRGRERSACRACSRRAGSATTAAASATCAGAPTWRRPWRRSAACR